MADSATTTVSGTAVRPSPTRRTVGHGSTPPVSPANPRARGQPWHQAGRAGTASPTSRSASSASSTPGPTSPAHGRPSRLAAGDAVMRPPCDRLRRSRCHYRLLVPAPLSGAASESPWSSSSSDSSSSRSSLCGAAGEAGSNSRPSAEWEPRSDRRLAWGTVREGARNRGVPLTCRAPRRPRGRSCESAIAARRTLGPAVPDEITAPPRHRRLGPAPPRGPAAARPRRAHRGVTLSSPVRCRAVRCRRRRRHHPGQGRPDNPTRRRRPSVGAVAHRSSAEPPRPVRAPTGSMSGVPRGHQSSWPGSDSYGYHKPSRP